MATTSKKQLQVATFRQCKEQTISLITCLTSRDISALAELEQQLTFTKAIQGTCVQVMARENKKETFTLIFSLVDRLQQSFSFNNKMTEGQITTFTFDLMEVMQHDTLEDIALLFKMARQGLLGGKIFRLDSQIILQEWLPSYLELKYQEKEALLEANKSEEKIDLVSNAKWTKESIAEIEKINKNFKAKRPANDGKKIADAGLDNKEAFVNEVKNNAKLMSKKALIEVIDKWAMRKECIAEVAILKAELETRNTKKITI